MCHVSQVHGVVHVMWYECGGDRCSGSDGGGGVCVCECVSVGV